MNSRCRHCWSGAAVVLVAYFAYFETRALRRQCHRTLSRELESLGPCAVLLPAVAGFALSWHLLTLKDSE